MATKLTNELFVVNVTLLERVLSVFIRSDEKQVLSSFHIRRAAR